MNAPATNFNVAITNLSTENQTLCASINPLLSDAYVGYQVRVPICHVDGGGAKGTGLRNPAFTVANVNEAPTGALGLLTQVGSTAGGEFHINTYVIGG